ncbi:MAG: hypothetical protein KKD39_04285 [Candidatus Altiarchaeota archaeon]|nr:hypothetical protein [Candidatus Altiarchaeota archaeon]
MEYTDLLYTLPHQLYALIFLLGSLSVASLSDLRRMAAQKDFAEIWWAYTILMFATDTSYGIMGELNLIAFATKWLLILTTLAIITTQKTLAISTMDHAALTALLSTLNPLYILLTIPATILINEILKPILKQYGDAGAYPFLPTIFAVNLLTIAATQTIELILNPV